MFLIYTYCPPGLFGMRLRKNARSLAADGRGQEKLAPPFRNPFVHDLRFTPLEKARVSGHLVKALREKVASIKDGKEKKHSHVNQIGGREVALGWVRALPSGLINQRGLQSGTS